MKKGEIDRIRSKLSTVIKKNTNTSNILDLDMNIFSRYICFIALNKCNVNLFSFSINVLLNLVFKKNKNDKIYK